MKLNLTKPLIIFDLETTGLEITKERIIQISYIKVMPDGEETRQDYFVNPEKQIPQEVIDLTHITNEMVAGKPTFKELASILAEDFAGCDFAGYNISGFDMPMLAEEFLRAGIAFDFSQCRLIDACTIFKKMERRNLAAAYKFYCGRNMEDDFQAHLASEDTEATYRVLMGQMDKYAPGANEDPEKVLINDMDDLHAFCNQTKIIDFARKIVYNDNNIAVFNFGKYKGMPVSEVLRRDPGYYLWMINGDFPKDTQQALTRLKMRSL